MALSVIDGGGLDLEEPLWDLLIPEPEIDGDGLPVIFRDVASRHWKRAVRRASQRQVLDDDNAHQLQRYALACARYDHAIAQVNRIGGVVKAPKTKVPMLSMWHTVAKQLADECTVYEAELGISPRRRSSATKAQRQTKKASAADAYLKPVRK